MTSAEATRRAHHRLDGLFLLLSPTHFLPTIAITAEVARVNAAIDLAILAARVETAEHICEMKDFEREQERDRLRREMKAMRGR